MTRAFVTGIGGQDGGYLAVQLVAEGVEVHGLAHEAEPAREPPEIELHPGDLARFDDVRRLVLDLAPDEIYNLAAVSSVARSWEEPELTHAVNGEAAVRLLRVARELQERGGRSVRFVQASSAEIFGEPDRSPQDESTPLRPVNPYGTAKAHAHAAVGRARREGLHASAAILYNHESPRRPPHFVTRKIATTVAAIARGEDRRLVLGNLDVRRDWGWAPEYVDAMVRAARADIPNDYVIATGVSHSVSDFVAAAFAHVGIRDWEGLVDVDAALVRPVDAAELVGDHSKAREVLGWTPRVRFEEVVTLMVDAELSTH
ncbi:GDP-mannose 4,6-dehydratase [Nocardioides sp.]|uniref:GDP-mannose 4,6-dehydratase n=1 Tax=Nocardioides sp. TaxID=35761 RepID=UPI002ED6BF76